MRLGFVAANENFPEVDREKIATLRSTKAEGQDRVFWGNRTTYPEYRR